MCLYIHPIACIQIYTHPIATLFGKYCIRYLEKASQALQGRWPLNDKVHLIALRRVTYLIILSESGFRLFKILTRDFPVSPGVRTRFHCRGTGSILVGELKVHVVMSEWQGKKGKNNQLLQFLLEELVESLLSSPHLHPSSSHLSSSSPAVNALLVICFHRDGPPIPQLS